MAKDNFYTMQLLQNRLAPQVQKDWILNPSRHYARTVGNPGIRKMTFHARGNMLKALALHLRNHLDKFYTISYQSGATRADSWVDIEGGIGNLFANASFKKKISR
jgi:acyl-CoA reductase-like NAD-dependent aldehyde dehydrogenase